jgi:hypothetical protein
MMMMMSKRFYIFLHPKTKGKGKGQAKEIC